MRWKQTHNGASMHLVHVSREFPIYYCSACKKDQPFFRKRKSSDYYCSTCKSIRSPQPLNTPEKGLVRAPLKRSQHHKKRRTLPKKKTTVQRMNVIHFSPSRGKWKIE